MSKNKMPIERHEKNAANYYISLERKRDELFMLQSEVDRMINEYIHRLYQITEAKRKGITEFDSSRFRVKK